MYIHTYVYKHTYTHIYICMYVHICCFQSIFSQLYTLDFLFSDQLKMKFIHESHIYLNNASKHQLDSSQKPVLLYIQKYNLLAI